MKIKRRSETPRATVPGSAGVTKQIIVGPDDGSDEIVLRYFSVSAGGSTPYHTHDFPHVVRIESGRGVAVNATQEEMPVAPGDYLYVAPDELHCFKNTGEDPFEFICIVPLRGELVGMPVALDDA
ncbi:MAG: cupin domain-containing protein [Actinobacteria bacterium]|nr:cupin domain-containing protein [Actinomycetota bacterium]OPZ76557.1 MAG: Cupin domain protein [Actinobacteria bacterium ADurb.Bin444]